MPLLWLLLGCFGEFAVALAGLALFMRWRERGLAARLGSKIEGFQTSVGEELAWFRAAIAILRETAPAPTEVPREAAAAAVSAADPANSHPADVRSTVLDLHRRGEDAPWIAAALGIRRADVNMMILVHDRTGR
jgi:hypothetical protein